MRPMLPGARVELARLAPLARGEVAAFTVADRSLRLPDLAFRDAEGASTASPIGAGARCCSTCGHLFVPCRKEMPALDALEGKLAGRLSKWSRSTRHPRSRQAARLAQGGRRCRLGYYADPALSFSGPEDGGSCRRNADDVAGRSSRLRDRTVAGPAEWASEDAVKLVTAALER